MATADFQVGDYGLAITFFVVKRDGTVRDISGASALVVQLTNPDGVLAEETAVEVTDGTDGGLTYVLVSGDLNKAGPWKARGKVTMSGTEEWRTPPLEFIVEG